MPSNPNPIARHREPTDLDIPVEQRQVFSFRNALEPIVQQKCLPCHGGETPDARLNLSLAKTADYSTAYESLMSASREPRLVNVSSVPFSRKSRLIDVLLGIGDRENQGAHPSGDQALTPGELRKFITWVDLGGQYW